MFPERKTFTKIRWKFRNCITFDAAYAIWLNIRNKLLYIPKYQQGIYLLHNLVRSTTHEIRLITFVFILLKYICRKLLINRSLANSWSWDFMSANHFTILSTCEIQGIYNMWSCIGHDFISEIKLDLVFLESFKISSFMEF